MKRNELLDNFKLFISLWSGGLLTEKELEQQAAYLLSYLENKGVLTLST